MRVLNLYAGIGGNRKLWGNEHEITAVEYIPEIAAKYKELFPNDTVIVDDAHQYLLDHFHEFDFIWSSPPCPSHSRINKANGLNPYKDNSKQLRNGGGVPMRFPDMRLYEEIVFLKHFHRGKWCVENVISYYEPLIQPMMFGSHYFWVNFALPKFEDGGIARGIGGKNHTTIKSLADRRGYDPKMLDGLDKEKVLRNCVEPELGKHILDWSQKEWHHTQKLFTSNPLV